MFRYNEFGDRGSHAIFQFFDVQLNEFGRSIEVAMLFHIVLYQLRRQNGAGDIMIPDIFSFFLRRKI